MPLNKPNLYRLCRMSRRLAQKHCYSNEEDISEFKEYWTEKCVNKENKALCIFCFETIACRTSSDKEQFENIHKN